jgi:YD repeat-containing protein
MKQLRSNPSPALRILLAAVLATGCDDATGPRFAAEPPPADDMRLATLTITDSAFGTTTRHRFIYDGAGRLQRVNFYITQPNGPPDWLTYYTEHTYAGELLRETNRFNIRRGGSGFVHTEQVVYDYDRLGYRVRETVRLLDGSDVLGEPADETFVIRFRYDTRGRLAERLEESGDRVIYGYGADGSLAQVEYRSHTGEAPVRQTFSYAGGRNPFYRRLAHASSLILPVGLETTLLAPANPARLETRVDDDPTLISSVTREYRFDGAGRPLHIREVVRNDHLPEARGFALLFDFEYEPAGG